MNAPVLRGLAVHDFGVLIEPVQALPVRAVEIEVDQGAARGKARFDRFEKRVEPLPPARRASSPSRSAPSPSPVNAETAIGSSFASPLRVARKPSRWSPSSLSSLFQISITRPALGATPSSARMVATSAL